MIPKASPFRTPSASSPFAISLPGPIMMPGRTMSRWLAEKFMIPAELARETGPANPSIAWSKSRICFCVFGLAGSSAQAK